jgi:mannose-6-phosphate isomerase-like protein (cupin superfamily)
LIPKNGAIDHGRQHDFAGKQSNMKKQSKLEYIRYGKTICAVILRRGFTTKGIEFLTPNHYSQQVAWMSHEKGKMIDAHVHNKVPRAITQTQEVLYLTKGKLQVDFYTPRGKYFCSRRLCKGDLLLLVSAGHGFRVLSNLEMFEIKQGPYLGTKDKRRFAHYSGPFCFQ